MREQREAASSATVARTARDPERVTVNLSRAGNAALRELNDETGLSLTELVNRALRLLLFVSHVTRDGGTMYVKTASDGKLERVHLL
jgi:hypothetical protein